MRCTPRSPLRAIVVVVVACVGVLASVVPQAAAETTDDKRAEAKQIAERLAELQEEQMELGATYERANYERHLADQEAADAQDRVDETNAELELRRQELRNFAISAYQGGNEAPTAAALLADGASNGTVKRFYLETTTGDRGDLIDALRSAQHAAEEEVEQLNAARAESEAHLAEIEDARAAAADATAKQDALNSRVQGELANLVAEEAAAHAARNTVSASLAVTAAAGPDSTTPAPPPPRSRPAAAPAPAPQPPAPAPPPSGSKAGGAISAALSKVGSGYSWGAAGPGVFDCSGLVLWAYRQVGVSLPHYSGAQYSMTTRISAGQLQPGDLVFWGPGGSEHVAIYMGGNQLVHAFSSAARVQVTALAGWWKTPSGYGRLNY